MFLSMRMSAWWWWGYLKQVRHKCKLYSTDLCISAKLIELGSGNTWAARDSEMEKHGKEGR